MTEPFIPSFANVGGASLFGSSTPQGLPTLGGQRQAQPVQQQAEDPNDFTIGLTGENAAERLKDPRVLSAIDRLGRMRGKTAFNSDQERVDWFYNQMNRVVEATNSLDAGSAISEAWGADDKQKADLGRLYKLWENIPGVMPWSEGPGSRSLWSAVADVVPALLLDPVNLIGGLAAKPVTANAMRAAVKPLVQEMVQHGVSSEAARLFAENAARKAVVEGVKKGVITESAANAGVSALQDLMLQTIYQEVGLQEGYDLGRLATAAGLGAAISAPIAGAVGYVGARAGLREVNQDAGRLLDGVAQPVPGTAGDGRVANVELLAARQATDQIDNEAAAARLAATAPNATVTPSGELAPNDRLPTAEQAQRIETTIDEVDAGIQQFKGNETPQAKALTELREELVRHQFWPSERAALENEAAAARAEGNYGRSNDIAVEIRNRDDIWRRLTDEGADPSTVAMELMRERLRGVAAGGGPSARGGRGGGAAPSTGGAPSAPTPGAPTGGAAPNAPTGGATPGAAATDQPSAAGNAPGGAAPPVTPSASAAAPSADAAATPTPIVPNPARFAGKKAAEVISATQASTDPQELTDAVAQLEKIRAQRVAKGASEENIAKIDEAIGGIKARIVPSEAPPAPAAPTPGAVTFTPTADWQDIPDDAILPPGLQIEMDATTGKKRARLAPGTETAAPAPEAPAGPDYAEFLGQNQKQLNDLIASSEDGLQLARLLNYLEDVEAGAVKGADGKPVTMPKQLLTRLQAATNSRLDALDVTDAQSAGGTAAPVDPVAAAADAARQADEAEEAMSSLDAAIARAQTTHDFTGIMSSIVRADRDLIHEAFAGHIDQAEDRAGREALMLEALSMVRTAMAVAERMAKASDGNVNTEHFRAFLVEISKKQPSLADAAAKFVMVDRGLGLKIEGKQRPGGLSDDYVETRNKLRDLMSGDPRTRPAAQSLRAPIVQAMGELGYDGVAISKMASKPDGVREIAEIILTGKRPDGSTLFGSEDVLATRIAPTEFQAQLEEALFGRVLDGPELPRGETVGNLTPGTERFRVVRQADRAAEGMAQPNVYRLGGTTGEAADQLLADADKADIEMRQGETPADRAARIRIKNERMLLQEATAGMEAITAQEMGIVRQTAQRIFDEGFDNPGAFEGGTADEVVARALGPAPTPEMIRATINMVRLLREREMARAKRGAINTSGSIFLGDRAGQARKPYYDRFRDALGAIFGKKLSDGEMLTAMRDIRRAYGGDVRAYLLAEQGILDRAGGRRVSLTEARDIPASMKKRETEAGFVAEGGIVDDRPQGGISVGQLADIATQALRDLDGAWQKGVSRGGVGAEKSMLFAALGDGRNRTVYFPPSGDGALRNAYDEMMEEWVGRNFSKGRFTGRDPNLVDPELAKLFGTEPKKAAEGDKLDEVVALTPSHPLAKLVDLPKVGKGGTAEVIRVDFRRNERLVRITRPSKDGKGTLVTVVRQQLTELDREAAGRLGYVRAGDIDSRIDAIFRALNENGNVRQAITALKQLSQTAATEADKARIDMLRGATGGRAATPEGKASSAPQTPQPPPEGGVSATATPAGAATANVDPDLVDNVYDRSSWPDFLKAIPGSHVPAFRIMVGPNAGEIVVPGATQMLVGDPLAAIRTRKPNEIQFGSIPVDSMTAGKGQKQAAFQALNVPREVALANLANVPEPLSMLSLKAVAYKPPQALVDALTAVGYRGEIKSLGDLWTAHDVIHNQTTLSSNATAGDIEKVIAALTELEGVLPPRKLPTQDRVSAMRALGGIVAEANKAMAAGKGGGIHASALTAMIDVLRRLRGDSAPLIFNKAAVVSGLDKRVSGGEAWAVGMVDKVRSADSSYIGPRAARTFSNQINLGGTKGGDREFVHELAHWLYMNALDGKQRLEFWEMVRRRYFGTDGKFNEKLYRADFAVPERGAGVEGVSRSDLMTPQELFAYMMERLYIAAQSPEREAAFFSPWRDQGDGSYVAWAKSKLVDLFDFMKELVARIIGAGSTDQTIPGQAGLPDMARSMPTEMRKLFDQLFSGERHTKTVRELYPEVEARLDDESVAAAVRRVEMLDKGAQRLNGIMDRMAAQFEARDGQTTIGRELVEEYLDAFDFMARGSTVPRADGTTEKVGGFLTEPMRAGYTDTRTDKRTARFDLSDEFRRDMRSFIEGKTGDDGVSSGTLTVDAYRNLMNRGAELLAKYDPARRTLIGNLDQVLSGNAQGVLQRQASARAVRNQTQRVATKRGAEVARAAQVPGSKAAQNPVKLEFKTVAEVQAAIDELMDSDTLVPGTDGQLRPPTRRELRATISGLKAAKQKEYLPAKRDEVMAGIDAALTKAERLQSLRRQRAALRGTSEEAVLATYIGEEATGVMPTLIRAGAQEAADMANGADAGIPLSAHPAAKAILSTIRSRDGATQETQRALAYRVMNLMGQPFRDALDRSDAVAASDLVEEAQRAMGGLNLRQLVADLQGDEAAAERAVASLVERSPLFSGASRDDAMEQAAHYLIGDLIGVGRPALAVATRDQGDSAFRGYGATGPAPRRLAAAMAEDHVVNFRADQVSEVMAFTGGNPRVWYSATRADGALELHARPDDVPATTAPRAPAPAVADLMAEREILRDAIATLRDRLSDGQRADRAPEIDAKIDALVNRDRAITMLLGRLRVDADEVYPHFVSSTNPLDTSARASHSANAANQLAALLGARDRFSEGPVPGDEIGRMLERTARERGTTPLALAMDAGFDGLLRTSIEGKTVLAVEPGRAESVFSDRWAKSSVPPPSEGGHSPNGRILMLAALSDDVDFQPGAKSASAIERAVGISIGDGNVMATLLETAAPNRTMENLKERAAEGRAMMTRGLQLKTNSRRIGEVYGAQALAHKIGGGRFSDPTMGTTPLDRGAAKAGGYFMPLLDAMRKLPGAHGTVRSWWEKGPRALLRGGQVRQAEVYNDVAKALRYGPNTQEYRDVIAKHGEPVKAFIAQVRRSFDDVHKELRDAGIDVGYITDYFGVKYDVMAIERNREAFTETIARKLAKGDAQGRPWDSADVMRQARETVSRIVDEEGIWMPPKAEARSPSEPHIDRQRKFNWTPEELRGDGGVPGMEQFISNDLEGLLATYFWGAGRKITFNQTFGPNGHWFFDYLKVAAGGAMGGSSANRSIYELLTSDAIQRASYSNLNPGDFGIIEVARTRLHGLAENVATKAQAEVPAMAIRMHEEGRSAAEIRSAVRDYLLRLRAEPSAYYARRADAIAAAVGDYAAAYANKGRFLDKEGIDFLEGTYRALVGHPIGNHGGMGGQALRNVRNFNNVTLLGFTAIASLPDLIMPLIRTGDMRAWMKGLVTMSRLGGAAGEEVREGLRRTGVAMENIVHNRMASLAGGTTGPMANAFFQANMLTPWTGFAREMSAATFYEWVRSEGRILQRAAAGERVNPKRERLARKALLHFFGEDLDVVLRGSLDSGDLFRTGTKTGDAFAAAANRFAQETVFSPDVNERPLWAQTPLGATVFQLKSFPLQMGRLGRFAWDEFKAGNPKPAMAMFAVAPAFAAWSMAIRDVVQMRGGEDERSAETRERKASEWLGQMGVKANLDPATDEALGWYLEAMMTGVGLGLLADMMHAAAEQADNGEFGKMRLISQVFGPTAGLLVDDVPNVLMGLYEGIADLKDGAAPERAAWREVITRVPIAGGVRAVREGFVDQMGGPANVNPFSGGQSPFGGGRSTFGSF